MNSIRVARVINPIDLKFWIGVKDFVNGKSNVRLNAVIEAMKVEAWEW